MKHTQRTRSVRLGVAGIVAGALALGMAASPASAAPTVAEIDPEAPVTLTVHSYLNPGGELVAGTGAALDAAATENLTPVQGLKYTAKKLPVDLTTAEGWQTLEDNKGDLAWAAANSVSRGMGATSDAEGTATFAKLDQGAWYVFADYLDGVDYQPVGFVVTLPMLTDGTWNYDVHAYPKWDAVPTVTKTVVEPFEAEARSDKTEFVTRIPLGTEIWDHITSFVVTEKHTQTPKHTYPKQYAVEVVNGDTRTPLADVTDYSGSRGTTTPYARTFTFSQAKIDLLKEKVTAPGAYLEIRGVASSGSYTGAQVNTVEVKYTVPGAARTTTASAEYRQQFLDITSWLREEGTADTKLTDGVEYAVYPTAADALAGTNAFVHHDDRSAFTPSTTSGFAAILVPASNWVSGTEVAEDAYRTYYVWPTKVPEGLNGPTEPIAVNVLNMASTGREKVDVFYAAATTPAPAFPLPLTGGAGTAAFAVAGLSILGAAAAIRRRTTMHS